MPNNTTKRTWALDTAEDIAISGWLKRLEWHPAAADNDIDVQDTDASILMKCRAPVACANDEAEAIIDKTFPGKGLFVLGLYLKTIDGGTLYVEWHRDYII